eukprot:15482830-Alexandrium_andersonii.AAC.1
MRWGCCRVTPRCPLSYECYLASRLVRRGSQRTMRARRLHPPSRGATVVEHGCAWMNRNSSSPVTLCGARRGA